MGICLFGSWSDFDKKISRSIFGGSNNGSITDMVNQNEIRKGNPNPGRYVIKKSCQIRSYLIVFINYPDCSNYEGNKILIFKDVKMSMLRKQKKIDPHFSKNHDFYSPIARFIPTDEGWKMAEDFCCWKMAEDLYKKNSTKIS